MPVERVYLDSYITTFVPEVSPIAQAVELDSPINLE